MKQERTEAVLTVQSKMKQERTEAVMTKMSRNETGEILYVDPAKSPRSALPDPFASITFASISDALCFCEEHPDHSYTIQVAPGIYREQLVIRTRGLILRGEEGRESETVITGALGGYEILEDGIKRGTFRTQTVLIIADDVTVENLTIENTAGPGHLAGQAIALHAYADRLCFRRLRLIGQQDTLFTGPLPEKEVEPGGFRGPTEHFDRTLCRMYFDHCYIEGNIDFIFGGACAWFEQCEIFCRDSHQGSDPIAYITAPSTLAGQPYGYVLNRCGLTSDCPPESCYLGRPWREHARAVLLHCSIGPHIRRELWDDWGKSAAHTHSFFAIYGCTRTDLQACRTTDNCKRTDPQAGKTTDNCKRTDPQIGKTADNFDEAASFSHQLTPEEAGEYTLKNVLGDFGADIGS